MKESKTQERISSLLQRVRETPLLAVAVVGGALVVAFGGWAAVHVGALSKLTGPASVSELAQEVKEDPTDAKARLELGHALFAKGKKDAALKTYERALVLDKEVGDEKLYENLLGCFGTAEQGDAASLIARLKLVRAEKGLEGLARNKSYKLRWAALQTLERLGKASRADFIEAWILDLESSDCEVRKHAVEQLGNEGDKRALAALREAKKKDQENKTGWFGQTCLGDGPEQAEKKILAHK